MVSHRLPQPSPKIKNELSPLEKKEADAKAAAAASAAKK
jgi:hypothetical protein